MKKVLFFAVMALVCMVSCKSQKTENTEELNDSTAVAVEEPEYITYDELAGTWYVLEVNGENVVMNDTTPEFTFNLDQMYIHVYAGCNQINGNIERKGRAMNSIEFTDGLSTKMACEDEKAELAICNALKDVRSFAGTKDQLELQNENAETIILLKR
ncbi:MAG: META domain-containing protein [Paludibacteraceae bacterium]|nr:META domain-containing protein [Paludibacteraceae bacterium]